MRISCNELALLFLAMSAATEASQRCDLVARKCLDFTNKSGASLTVPAATTRIPQDGLVLCDVPGSSPAPTDIVYIVDESTSMEPTAIQVFGNDTTGWFGCTTGNRGLACNGSFRFHGAQVCQIPSNTAMSTIRSAGCQEAGDVYSARAEAVYASIRSQARRAPGSNAATINFNHGVSSTQDSMTLLDPAGVNRLLATVPMDVSSFTDYEAPLEWARILLNGGANSSRGTTIPASSSAGKAVILISDGQPNEGDWQIALGALDTVAMDASMFPGVANAASFAGKWMGKSASVPPVYGIYLGNAADNDNVLRTISERTGGSFHLIPPNQPDSLSRVIEGILGELIGAAVPTTFSITNLSNGYTSKAAEPSFDQAAGGYRVVLDSLLPLESGMNDVVLRTMATVDGVSTTILDTIKVDVSSEGSTTQGGQGLASSLAARCNLASTLSLTPDVSGLPHGEAGLGDANILTTLTTIPTKYASLPVRFTTTGRTDREALSLAIPPTAADTLLGGFKGRVAWNNLAGGSAIALDGVLRSGYGWDTAIATFQMPRDKRDTASARLALHRPVAPLITMTNSVIGPSGTIDATVVDSSATGPTVVVRVRSDAGPDTLLLTLTRGADHVYSATFRFVQGAAADLTNSVLELEASDGLGHAVTGTYSSLEGEVSAKAMVVSDALPKSATMLDSDADGRADRVVVVLGAPLKVSDSIGFSWPDTSGVPQSRLLPLHAGRASADGLVLTFDLDPFAFGATSCPVAGCQGLGSLWSSQSAEQVKSMFAIDDGVDPVPTVARYRYAALAGGLDTLIVGFSEKVDPGHGAGTWVSVGKPGLDSLGAGVVPLRQAWLDQPSRTAYFLVDSAFVGGRGDSLRITTSVSGALADTFGNAPERLAYWTPVRWGTPRPSLALDVPHPVVDLGTIESPPSEPAVTRLVRATEDAPWTSADGIIGQDISRLSGLVVRLNRIPESLKLYIYDNMGVDVLHLQFDDLDRLVEAGALQRTRRGDYELWMAWDGKDGQGRKVATGVYSVRLLARIKDEEYGRLVLHGIRKVGVHRAVPH